MEESLRHQFLMKMYTLLFAAGALCALGATVEYRYGVHTPLWSVACVGSFFAFSLLQRNMLRRSFFVRIGLFLATSYLLGMGLYPLLRELFHISPHFMMKSGLIAMVTSLSIMLLTAWRRWDTRVLLCLSSILSLLFLELAMQLVVIVFETKMVLDVYSLISAILVSVLLVNDYLQTLKELELDLKEPDLIDCTLNIFSDWVSIWMRIMFISGASRAAKMPTRSIAREPNPANKQNPNSGPRMRHSRSRWADYLRVSSIALVLALVAMQMAFGHHSGEGRLKMMKDDKSKAVCAGRHPDGHSAFAVVDCELPHAKVVKVAVDGHGLQYRSLKPGSKNEYECLTRAIDDKGVASVSFQPCVSAHARDQKGDRSQHWEEHHGGQLRSIAAKHDANEDHECVATHKGKFDHGVGFDFVKCKSAGKSMGRHGLLHWMKEHHLLPRHHLGRHHEHEL